MSALPKTMQLRMLTQLTFPTSFMPRLSLFMLWFRQELQDGPKMTTLLQNPQAILSGDGEEEVVALHGNIPTKSQLKKPGLSHGKRNWVRNLHSSANPPCLLWKHSHP